MLGNKNEDAQDSENGSGPEDENEIIFEKFFISQDSDLSS